MKNKDPKDKNIAKNAASLGTIRDFTKKPKKISLKQMFDKMKSYEKKN